MTEFAFQKSDSRFAFQKDSSNNTGGVDDIPIRLKRHSQWLVTHDRPDDEKRHKAPKYPSEGWNCGDLLSFEEARQRFEQDAGTGVAFRFTADGPFVGFDLDDVKEGGTFTDEAQSIVSRLDSYTEVSSSGTGLHVIAEGEKIDGRKARGDLAEAGHLEVYDESRYFVLTGDVYNDRTTVKERTTAVREVQNNHLPESRTVTNNGEQKPMSEQDLDGGQTEATPEQVRRTIEAYGASSEHSVDAERVLRLWRGSDAPNGGDTSRADMSFVKQLHYWCKGDQQLMDECFRSSDRMREKWDEVHTSNGDTYGEMTIQQVCRTNHQTFGGDYVNT